MIVVQQHIRHFDDLGFTVIAEVDHDYYVKYTVYSIVGTTIPDELRLYERAGGSGGMDTVEKLLNAQVYLSGEVKWDGCSNWTFDEQDHCALHFCDRTFDRVSDIMGECWDWTKELCPNWDKSLR